MKKIAERVRGMAGFYFDRAASASGNAPAILFLKNQDMSPSPPLAASAATGGGEFNSRPSFAGRRNPRRAESGRLESQAGDKQVTLKEMTTAGGNAAGGTSARLAGARWRVPRALPSG